RDPVIEGDPAVGTRLGDQSEGARAISVENEVFAEQANALRRARVKLGHAGNRVPVAAQEVTARRPWPHARQLLIQLARQHCSYPRRGAFRAHSSRSCAWKPAWRAPVCGGREALIRALGTDGPG